MKRRNQNFRRRPKSSIHDFLGSTWFPATLTAVTLCIGVVYFISSSDGETSSVSAEHVFLTHAKPSDPSNGSKSITPNTVRNDIAAFSSCDKLTADGSDPEARSAGVDDDTLIGHLDESLSACRNAVDLASGSRSHARLFFQYGRALQLASDFSRAQAQLSIAAEMGHAGAMAGLIEVYLMLDEEPEPEQLQQYADYLQHSLASGYEPASELLSAIQYMGTEIQDDSSFKANGFANPDIMQAAYEGDFSSLSSVKTALVGDHMGLKRGLATYTKSFAKQLSEIWTCAGYDVPGLAAAAERTETEHITDKVFTDPLSLVAGGLDWLGAMTSEESRNNPTLGSVVTDTVRATARQRETLIRLNEQGKFDAVRLQQHYGCDHTITQQIIGNLSLYFQAH